MAKVKKTATLKKDYEDNHLVSYRKVTGMVRGVTLMKAHTGQKVPEKIKVTVEYE